MDGVLVDSAACHCRAYADLWRRLGLQGPPYAELAGRPTREAVAQYAAGLTPDAAQVRAWVAFKQRRARHYLATQPIAFGDTSACLEMLGRIPLAVGTAASRTTARLLLERLGLVDHFALILTAEDIRRGKPAPDIYRSCLQRLGVQADRALVVEDSPAGIQAGLAAGAWTASVRSGQTVDHPAFAGAWDNLAQLGRHLRPYLP